MAYYLFKLLPRRRGSNAQYVRGVALFVLALSTAAGAAETLTVDRALRLAQERSRQLSAQDAAVSAARDMAAAAGELPDPTLKVGINNLPVNGPDAFSTTRDFMTMRSVGVMQEFTRGDKRKARAARYDREAATAEAGRALALSNLQQNTVVAWLDRYYLGRLRDNLQRQRDEAKLQVDAAEAAYRGGGSRGSQADVFAARAAVAQIEDRLAQTEREVAVSKAKLARWVGDAAGDPLGALPDTQAVPFKVADLEQQLAHHPQLAVLARQEDTALADAEIARANKQADWSAELMYSQRGPSYSNMISFNVSIPLQWDQKNKQDRELAAKLATVEQLRAQREEAIRAHVAEVQAMLQEWRSGRERLVRYDSALVPLVGERTRAAIAAYRGGTGTLSAVLEARRTEIETQMERTRLEMETARLWAQLNYLVPAGHDAVASGPQTGF
jgi:outer membrane protein TolC